MLGPRRGHDPVDHRRGKRDRALDPRVQLGGVGSGSSATNSSTSARTCSPLRATLSQLTIAIGSPCPRQRCCSPRASRPIVVLGGAPPRSARTCSSRCPARSCAGARGVAALGDRERRDARLGIGEPRDDRLRARRRRRAARVWTPTTSGAPPPRPSSRTQYRPSWARSASTTPRERCATPTIPHGPASCSSAARCTAPDGRGGSCRGRGGRCPACAGGSRGDEDARRRGRGASGLRAQARVTSRASCRRRAG